MNKINRKQAISFLGPVFLGLFYGKIEQKFIIPTGAVMPMDYRLLYVGLLVLPFVGSRLDLWIAKSLVAMAVQDASFWLFAGWVPKPWAWYYPIMYDIPLDDVLAILIVAGILFRPQFQNLVQASDEPTL